MARALDPAIVAILKEHGFGKEAVWDCHGTWVVYHRVIEQIAAKAGVEFDQPFVVEANGEKGIAAVCVTGRMGTRTVWSIGEAAPKNNKNSYPWAMAEKRAVDRVVLKLIGLHGLAYSEEEADDFKATPPGRDIMHGVGSTKADPPELEMYTPWGEATMGAWSGPQGFLEALTVEMEKSGAWFPPNKHTVEWIGKTFSDDKPLKDLARKVYKFGVDAWKNAPENPDNMEAKGD